MSFARTISFQSSVGGANLVRIDIDNRGFEHGVQIVGLPDKAVTESKERVMTALNSLHNMAINQGLHKITISLAPAELPKHGPTFDLAIAVGILTTCGVIKKDNTKRAYIGELTLDGSISPVKGVIQIADAAQKEGIEEIFVPIENAREAALISNINIYAIKNLSELILHFTKLHKRESSSLEKIENTEYLPEENIGTSYLAIKGQAAAKRGLLIAAAGGHNIALYGPPGTGKTLLARSLIELLPPLKREQMLETTMLHSLMGTLKHDYISAPPFRSPHHSSSMASIIGGGPNIRAGEIALANNGILFMDEFPEFQSNIIEALREPIEDGKVRIARVKGTTQFNTRFILAIAMNPCPCGFLGDPKRECTCSQGRIDSYKRKLSGPIMDRMDMWIGVPRISNEELFEANTSDISELTSIRKKVKAAHESAYERQGEGKLNSHLLGSELEKFAPLTNECKDLLTLSSEKLLLSPRGIHRTIRLARTISDLEGAETITTKHISEALSYRQKER